MQDEDYLLYNNVERSEKTFQLEPDYNEYFSLNIGTYNNFLIIQYEIVSN
jgi:hypothetical protein